jgi:putative flippase GtrA
MGKIKDIIEFFTKYEFFRFVLIGGTATLIDWILFYIFSIKLNIYYQLSLVMSFSVSVCFNFIFTKMFTFKNKSKKHLKQFFIYLSISLISLVLSMGIMFIFVEKVLLDKMVSRVFTTGIVLFVNYVVHKNLTFNKKIFSQD